MGTCVITNGLVRCSLFAVSCYYVGQDQYSAASRNRSLDDGAIRRLSHYDWIYDVEQGVSQTHYVIVKKATYDDVECVVTRKQHLGDGNLRVRSP